MFDKTKGVPTIVHNTDNDTYEFVKNGDKYAFDVNVIDPSGNINSNLSVLKKINPVTNNILESNQFDYASQQYTKVAQNMNLHFGELLRNFPKTDDSSSDLKQ